jgi:hypothetical protein
MRRSGIAKMDIRSLISRQPATPPFGGFPCRIYRPLHMTIDGAEDTHARQQHRPAILGGFDDHLDGDLPIGAVVLCLRELPDVIGDGAQCSRWRTTRKGDWLIKRAVPGHRYTNRDANCRQSCC